MAIERITQADGTVLFVPSFTPTPPTSVITTSSGAIGITGGAVVTPTYTDTGRVQRIPGESAAAWRDRRYAVSQVLEPEKYTSEYRAIRTATTKEIIAQDNTRAAERDLEEERSRLRDQQEALERERELLRNARNLAQSDNGFDWTKFAGIFGKYALYASNPALPLAVAAKDMIPDAKAGFMDKFGFDLSDKAVLFGGLLIAVLFLWKK